MVSDSWASLSSETNIMMALDWFLILPAILVWPLILVATWRFDHYMNNRSKMMGETALSSRSIEAILEKKPGQVCSCGHKRKNHDSPGVIHSHFLHSETHCNRCDCPYFSGRFQ